MVFLLETRNVRMREVYDIARKVAPSSSTVLILGESGTGKEVLARYIHYQSGRKGEFIAINCAAIPEELLEAELFGYEKGAFTGATRSKPGKFELASDGTLFLDEIGELPLKMQAKLLRALQERVIDRLGGDRPIRINTRIISATNQDLEKLVRAGRFREDLYFRLNVIPIHIPPLRERKEDIPLLAEFLISKICKRENLAPKCLSPEVLEIFLVHSWPGNVRELENLLERMLILSEGEVLTLEDLPPHLRELKKASSSEQTHTESLLEERTFFTKRFIDLPELDETKGISLQELLRERNMILKLFVGLLLFSFEPQSLSAKNENRTYNCLPEVSNFLLLEKEKILRKQRELEARERELKLLEKRIEEQINTLKQLSLEVDEKLNRITSIQDERIKLLAKAYSEMKPAKAAQQLINMDKEMAVKILSQLKSSQVASILSAMPPEKAAVLAEALSGYPPREY